MRRAYAALITGSLIFVLTYLSAWISMHNSLFMGWGYGSDGIYSRMRNDVGRRVYSFCKSNGRYPDSLKELKDYLVKHCGVEEYDAADLLIDFWDKPFIYEKTDAGFRLTSLGRMGDPDGVGINAPIVYDGKTFNSHHPTFIQFITIGAGSKTLFTIALIASVSVGLIYFVSEKKRLSSVSAANYVDGTTPSSKPEHVIRTAVKMTITIAVTVFVALLMVGFHVVTQQSGH